MNVFDRAERLLPQLEVGRRLELLESGFKIKILRLRQSHIRAVALVAILHEVGQVVAKNLAQTTELRRALVRDAELKRAVRCHCVQCFEFVVVAQDLEYRAVRLPQKLEPRRDELAVRTIFVVLDRDGLQHQIFGSVLGLEIVDLECRRLR